MSTPLNWDNLRFFLAIARAGSISGAAQSLGVSHTTVARRMDAMEGQLNCRIFDRTPEGYALTQAGEEIVDEAIAIEELTNGIERKVHGRDAQLSGRLTVTMPDDFATAVLIPHLAEFTDAYPGIDFHLVTTREMLNLSARAADIAVRLTTHPPEDLIAKRLMPLRAAIYGHVDYIANPTEPLSAITYPGDVWEWTHQFPGIRVVLTADSAASVATAIRAKMGIGMLPCFYADADPSLRRLDVASDETTWSVWLLSHPDLRTTARIRAGRAFLESIILGQRALILGENSRYATLSGDQPGPQSDSPAEPRVQ